MNLFRLRIDFVQPLICVLQVRLRLTQPHLQTVYILNCCILCALDLFEILSCMVIIGLESGEFQEHVVVFCVLAFQMAKVGLECGKFVIPSDGFSFEVAEFLLLSFLIIGEFFDIFFLVGESVVKMMEVFIEFSRELAVHDIHILHSIVMILFEIIEFTARFSLILFNLLNFNLLLLMMFFELFDLRGLFGCVLGLFAFDILQIGIEATHFCTVFVEACVNDSVLVIISMRCSRLRFGESGGSRFFVFYGWLTSGFMLRFRGGRFLLTVGRRRFGRFVRGFARVDEFRFRLRFRVRCRLWLSRRVYSVRLFDVSLLF